MDRNVCLSKDRELSIFPHIRWSIQYIIVYNTHQTKTYDQLFRDLVWWIFFPEQIIVESHIRLLWPNLKMAFERTTGRSVNMYMLCECNVNVV